MGVRLEHDPRPAFPLFEAIRTGANCASVDVATCGFDNFAGHSQRLGQILLDVRIAGLVEPKLECVAIEST